jgi:hypothetical protein
VDTPRGAQADTTENGTLPGNAAAREVRDVSVDGLAVSEWIELQFHQAHILSQFASQRAVDERVQQLAADLAQSHAKIAESFRLPAERAATEGQSAVGSGALAQELENVAERLQEAAQDTTPTGDTAATAPRREPPRTRLADRLEGNQGLLQRLRDAAQDARIRRGTARERVQNVLPILRESLPEVVDLVTEALEESAQPGNASVWLRMQRDFAQRHVAAIQDELTRYEAAAFDQAYLGYEVLMHRQLEAALETAQGYAGEGREPAIAAALQDVQTHSREARQLMLNLADGNVAADLRGPTNKNPVETTR